MECSNLDTPRLDEERFAHLCAQIEREAADLLLKGIDWAQFFRLVLGRNGLVARAFGSPEEMERYTDSESYVRLHEMWAALRRTQEGKKAVAESLVVMTIRVPKSPSLANQRQQTLRGKAGPGNLRKIRPQTPAISRKEPRRVRQPRRNRGCGLRRIAPILKTDQQPPFRHRAQMRTE